MYFAARIQYQVLWHRVFTVLAKWQLLLCTFTTMQVSVIALIPQAGCTSLPPEADEAVRAWASRYSTSLSRRAARGVRGIMLSACGNCTCTVPQALCTGLSSSEMDRLQNSSGTLSLWTLGNIAASVHLLKLHL